MSTTKKILIGLGIAALITAIILFIRYKQKLNEVVNTQRTGTVDVTTQQTGAQTVNISGDSLNGEPVYETGWDGFKAGDTVTNISSAFETVVLKPKLLAAPWPVMEIGKKLVIPAGSYITQTENIPSGNYGKILYIDGFLIQITTDKGGLIQRNRDEFNTYWAGKYIAVKQ